MSKRVSVDDCRIIQLPKHMQESGSITVVENNRELPFAVKRVYYLYDVPGGEERGGHSHKQLYEFLVAAGGSFDVLLDDGERTRTVTLNRPYYGLLIVPCPQQLFVGLGVSGADLRLLRRVRLCARV